MAARGAHKVGARGRSRCVPRQRLHNGACCRVRSPAACTAGMSESSPVCDQGQVYTTGHDYGGLQWCCIGLTALQTHLHPSNLASNALAALYTSVAGGFVSSPRAVSVSFSAGGPSTEAARGRCDPRLCAMGRNASLLALKTTERPRYDLQQHTDFIHRQTCLVFALLPPTCRAPGKLNVRQPGS